MKKFNLLLKNAFKSIGNSKLLVTQFTCLSTIAVVIVSSIFLGNFSLANSMKNVEEQSNLSGFSIEENQLNNFATYNLVKNNKNYVYEISEQNYPIYNPLLIEQQFNINQQNHISYGYLQAYTNKPEDVTNKGLWEHIVYSQQNSGLSIIPELSTIAADKRSSVQDVFSFYENVLPPSPTEIEQSKYEVLFDESIYSFNPWTLKLHQNKLMVNDFGLIDFVQFNNAKGLNNKLDLNHGVLFSDLGIIVGTDQYLLTKEEMAPLKTEIDTVNLQIILANSFDQILSNNWKQSLKTDGFLDANDFKLFYENLDIIDFDKIFPIDYWMFLNSCITNIKEKAFMLTKTITLNYQIDANNSSGMSKFFSNIYSNPNYNKDTIFNTIDPEYNKYFEGQINIPLIPFITVIPKQVNLPPNEIKKWTQDPILFTDLINHSTLNKENIELLVNKSFNVLSEKTNAFLEQVLNEPNNEKIIKEYYSKYNLDYYLSNDLKLEYSKTSNLTINDSDGNSFILSRNDPQNTINKIVLSSGINLFQSYIGENLIGKGVSYLYFLDIQNQIIKNPNLTNEQKKKLLLRDQNLWFSLGILNQSMVFSDEIITQKFYNYLYKILDKVIFNSNFELWMKIFNEFCDVFRITNIVWNGSGYRAEIQHLNSLQVAIEFTTIYEEPSSYMSVISLNYNQIKNNNKQVVDSEFVTKANELPYKSQTITKDMIIKNPAKYENHFIYNPYSKQVEFYNDFLDWLNRLDGKYKIQINGENRVIIGTGINVEFQYPVMSSNQLLINNNSPVVFMNSLGFDKIAVTNNISYKTNYWVNFKNEYNILENNKQLQNINDWTQNVYGKRLAYLIDDNEQPNQLLYVRINFPHTILTLVLVITLIIGICIVILALIFLFILMRSIIKKNMNTFAISMANGVKKSTLLFSLLPYVLIPSGISAILGYGFSFFLYPMIAVSVQDYWILDYIRFGFSFGYLLLVLTIVFLISFTILTIAVYITLRHDVSVLMNKRIEFKYNSFVKHSHILTKRMKPIGAFRLTYALGNFSKLIILLLMMTAFVSLTVVYPTTTNMFTVAMQKTKDNKLYNYAIDLYSPTAQGGYYYDIPYNLVGTTQKGLYGLYNLNSDTGFYNKDYKDDLTYNIPGTNDSLVYDNLFLPNAGLISDVQGNLQFFRNKILSLSTMDIGINFAGNYINPWEWAKKFLDPSLLNIVEIKLQHELSLVFYYVLSIQDEQNNPDKDIWYFDKSINKTLVDDLNNSKNPEHWNQDNWIFQYKKNKSNEWMWKSNEQYLTTGLPNFTLTQSATNFAKSLIAFKNNPNYLKFVDALKQKHNLGYLDFNFMAALNVVPIIPELDETYTYINANVLNNQLKNQQVKIMGIKPNSNQVVLWDEYNNIDLKTKLLDFELNTTTYDNLVFPLIINEIVAEKYKVDLNDEFTINPTNDYNRHINKFNQVNEHKTYKFKVVGITTSKSEEQYYTTQKIANYILELKQPELATAFDIANGNYDFKWYNQQEIDEYIPFNGVFSKQELPKMLVNFATLYPISGLSPIGGGVPNAAFGDSFYQLNNNYALINKIMKFDIIQDNKKLNEISLHKFREKYIEIFGTDKYMVMALKNIDASISTTLIGSVIDKTLGNINAICVTALVPSIIIIIMLMSYLIVDESRRLVALLKVLGFSNWSNTITLSTIQFIVVGLSILLGYGFAGIVVVIMKTFAFNSFSILINPIIPWWTFFVTVGVLLVIVSITVLVIYLSLRKSNPAQEIAVK